jgi:O-antigen ligase
MGTGMALATGQMIQCLRSNVKSQGAEIKEKPEVKIEGRNWKSEIWKYGVILCLFAMVFMGRGLLHSYSRGAWCGTFLGLGVLVSRAVQSSRFNIQSRWVRVDWLLILIILASILVLYFWQFRQTNWHPVRRVFSVVNAADFSWRNRIYAWEGALQIAAEHPWFGTGWNQPESLYDHYYLSAKLIDGSAIELNDYLMLGASLGVPALICFGMYIWLTLRQNGKCRIKNEEWSEADWQQTICHAGAIVLLVGFWFDGGLFKLPTAATFWILLELGGVRPQNYLIAADTKQSSELRA